MSPTFKRKLSISVVIIVAVFALAAFYVRTHPLVFNDSFFGHTHCIKGAGLVLQNYASEHGGNFPSHPNGYGDALVMMSEWDAALTGPGYDTKVFDRVRRTGEDAPESEFGRVYVQGLRVTDNQNIAILFDKMPTPGGDHCHGFRRLTAPLGREILLINGSMRFIPETQWLTFSKEQIDLLVAAGIERDKAVSYYSELPK